VILIASLVRICPGLLEPVPVSTYVKRPRAALPRSPGKTPYFKDQNGSNVRTPRNIYKRFHLLAIVDNTLLSFSPLTPSRFPDQSIEIQGRSARHVHMKMRGFETTSMRHVQFLTNYLAGY
jgi:hypothetical protein